MRSLDDLATLVPRQIARGLASGDLQPTATDHREVEDGGVPFSVHVVRGADRKKRSRREQERSGLDPFLPPYDDDLYVADASATHVVLLNKFPVRGDHLIVVTRAFESQESALGEPDFEALAGVMQRLGGLGFYNAGPVAGASQPHKHLQWIPLAPGGLPTRDLLKVGDGFDCAFATLASDRSRHADVYQTLLDELRLAPGDPYNLLIAGDEMFVIPRTEHGAEGVWLNAMAYAGSFLAKREEHFARLREVGPRRLLASCGRTG